MSLMSLHQLTPKANTILRHAFLLIVLLVCAYPLFWMALTAFKLEAEAQAAPFALPHRWVLKNFAKVFNSGDFGHAYLNSLLICVTSVVVAVVFSACAAFAFALFDFKGRNVLFIAFLLGMMIPVHVTLIPLNLLLGPQYLNIKESLWALAGPYIGFALPVLPQPMHNYHRLPKKADVNVHRDYPKTDSETYVSPHQYQQSSNRHKDLDIHHHKK